VQSEEDKLPRVNAADAKRLVEAKQAVLVDVRSQAAYDASHAQGALHLDVTDIEAGKTKSLPHDKEIIPYCT
jgi:rhodanese-related sulfurtransferase